MRALPCLKRNLSVTGLLIAGLYPLVSAIACLSLMTQDHELPGLRSALRHHLQSGDGARGARVSDTEGSIDSVKLGLWEGSTLYIYNITYIYIAGDCGKGPHCNIVSLPMMIDALRTPPSPRKSAPSFSNVLLFVRAKPFYHCHIIHHRFDILSLPTY
jgi:hypothetical protein